jgi:hypothetical protein
VISATTSWLAFAKYAKLRELERTSGKGTE